MGSQYRKAAKKAASNAKVVEPEKDNEREVARSNAEQSLAAFSAVIGAGLYINEYENHVEQHKAWLRAEGGSKERIKALLLMHSSTCRNNIQLAISILPPIGNAKAYVCWLSARLSSNVLVALDLKLDIDCVRAAQNLAYLCGVEVTSFLGQSMDGEEEEAPQKEEEKPN